MKKTKNSYDFINNYTAIIRDNKLIIFFQVGKTANAQKCLTINLNYILKLLSKNLYYLNNRNKHLENNK